jgi:predicted ATP-grasp superfamily ATP-dependent carboligase
VRIFVYESVTGGGLTGEGLPPGLAREADMMVRALLDDLAEIPGIRVLTSRDPRLPALAGSDVIAPAPDEKPLALFERGLAAADAAWPTAPETGGALERLARVTLDRRKVLFGSGPEAVRVTASKYHTFALLRAKGIPVAQTFSSPGDIPSGSGRWVIKPDDGAGSDDVRSVADWSVARAQLETRAGRLVAQPWLDGDVQSLSLICAEGHALLLSVNRLHVRCTNGCLSLAGITINAVTDHSGRLAELAESIAAAIPALWGYVGVDFVQTRDGPIVLEINPRLTTSYCGLRAALGINVASMVLDLWQSGALRRSRTPGSGTAVEITLEIPGA